MRESCTSGSERGKPRKGLTYLPNFSEFSYRTKTLRGMRTARIRKMAAGAAALRRASPACRTLFYLLINIVKKLYESFYKIKNDGLGR